MNKLLFIEDDDIVGLSNALRDALERRGIVFKEDGTGEFDYPFGEYEEPLYLRLYRQGGCGSSGCGCRSGSACGGSTYVSSHVGCGGFPRC